MSRFFGVIFLPLAQFCFVLEAARKMFFVKSDENILDTKYDGSTLLFLQSEELNRAEKLEYS